MKNILDKLKGFFLKWKNLFINLGLIIATGIILVLIFFYIFLPSYTHHMETITVPDLTGLQYDQLDDFLTKRKLRYEVVPDSEYVEQEPPLAIMRQYPYPGDKVKENRKIYITLNATTAPRVNMPNLVGKTYNTAQVILENNGLKEGELIYENDYSVNTVLEQRFEGRAIEEGIPVPKGSRIDLIVSMGLGQAVISTPELIGKNIFEAEFVIEGSNLQVGGISIVTNDQHPEGTIVNQVPSPGEQIREGEAVDLWVTEYDEADSVTFDPEEFLRQIQIQRDTATEISSPIDSL